MRQQARFVSLCTATFVIISNLPAVVVAQGTGSDPNAAPPLIRQSEYARWCATLPADYPQLPDYRRVLLRWVAGAEDYWTTDPDHPELGICRMKSSHVHVCTARALPVYAALAADTRYEDPTWTREKLAQRINAVITFLCATYDPAGPHDGFWGKKPGKNSLRYETWIIGNMLDVLQMAPEIVEPDNARRIREILVDIVEDERTSGRALSLADYRHEGIIWTLNLLARGAILYPDHPQAEKWLELAKYGFASALSVPADQEDETLVDGKPVREWVARRPGVFHPDFTLDHHGLGTHTGYMCMAAHREAALYDMMRRSGMDVSPIWYNHYRDVMNVIKDLELWDGRVVYPNGKDWADYLYGISAMRYQMVALQMMFHDPEARLIEQGLFRQLEWLQLHREHGDFGPSNAEYVFNVNDAKNIAFPYFLHQVHGFVDPVPQAELDRAHSKVHLGPEGKFVYVRDPQRFASWGWQAIRNRKSGEQHSTGLVIPCGHGLGDHLAQWDDSLTPAYSAADETGKRATLFRKPPVILVETFHDGFAVSERNDMCMPVKKGENPVPCLVDQRVMAALPDGRTVFVATSARAVRPVAQLETADLNWRFLRTIFSDSRRTIFHEEGHAEAAEIKNVGTAWLNVDKVLGLIPLGSPACASCEIAGDSVSLRLQSLPPRDYEPGQEISTVGAAFVTDVNATRTRALVESCQEETLCDTARVYRLRGQDGRAYAVAVNFADQEVDVDIPGAAAAALLTPHAISHQEKMRSTLRLRIAPRGCVVLIL